MIKIIYMEVTLQALHSLGHDVDSIVKRGAVKQIKNGPVYIVIEE